ncbi:MAG: hypothetical protein JW807_11780 [Spirochaetes bacterium]|nr:hypothetical protein [Spirochaetota bacterium]
MYTDRLNRFINNESMTDYRNYGLDTVGTLLGHFGNPHRSFTAIHITGTNGKGSVAHMLHTIFSRAGYTAGLYTSPHLLKLNERIRVGDNLIQNDDIERYLDEIIDYADAGGLKTLTYFDILTVCAFRYFYERRTDIAIVETGLGGRLDSTNVITPISSIITDISMDHANVLGRTLPAIAGEKAGIIKESVPVITSNTDPEVMKVIGEAASSRQAALIEIGRDFSAWNVEKRGPGFAYNYSMTAGPRAEISGIELNLPLGKQVVNSCCAITACIMARPQFPALSDDIIRSSLKTLVIPGRFQVLARRPLIIFDPAHNEAALIEMMKLLRENYSDREFTFVLTLMKDKDIPAIISVLAANRTRILYCVIDDPRCYHPPAGAPYETIVAADADSLYPPLDRLISDNSLFFFTGSFRNYGAAIGYAGHCSRSFPGFMPPPPEDDYRV